MSPTSKRYPVELRERVVRMVGEIHGDHGWEWAAMTQVARLLGVGVDCPAFLGLWALLR